MNRRTLLKSLAAFAALGPAIAASPTAAAPEEPPMREIELETVADWGVRVLPERYGTLLDLSREISGVATLVQQAEQQAATVDWLSDIDDTEFIQSCIDNDVPVPVGVYRLSHPVMLRSNQRLVGERFGGVAISGDVRVEDGATGVTVMNLSLGRADN